MNFDDQQITERIQTFLSEENLTDQAREFISSFPIEYLEFLSHRLEQVITLPFFPELVEEILTILENQDFDSSHDSHSPFLTLSTSILLQCLSLQSQSEPNDDYGSAEAAAVGLQLLTEKSEDDEESGEQFHSLVLPFIQSNITHDDWRKRDAAIMAFGTIIGTPLRQSQRNLQLVRAMIPILLTSSQPNHTPALIRSSAVWAIGRLFQGNLSFLLSANISPTPLLNGLTNSLSDPNARVQEQTVSAIAHFGEALPEDIRDSSVRAILSLLVGRLFQFTSPQSNPNLDSKVKFASYSALSCLIENNPLEDEQQAVMLLEEVIRRLQWALEHSIADLEPLCGFLSSSFVSLSFGSLQPHADTLVNLLLRSLPYTPSDGFISLGRLISECPEAIQTHHAAILGAVIRRLDSDPCQDSISLVGDICHSFLEGVTPYAHTLIPRLLAILHNPNHRKLQPFVITSIGDIFLTVDGAEIGQHVSPFLDSLRALQTPEIFEFDEDDLESFDSSNQMIESFLTAYTSVIQSIKLSPHRNLLSPHLGTIIHLIQRISVSFPSLLSEAIGLLGDLWAVYGAQVEDHISRQDLTRLIQECEQHVDSSVLGYLTDQISRGRQEVTGAADDEMNTDE